MSEWFQKAFGEYYLRLYSHRNDAEAVQVVDLILEHTGIKPGALVLDAPCGAGRHLRAFQARGLKAFGFDLSPELLREAMAEGAEPGHFVRADLRALPFQKERVDLLVNLFSSLGYFESDAVNHSVLNELVSLVRPGGWVVVDFMNSEHVRKHLKRESHRVTDEGLQVQDVRSIDGTPPRVNKKTVVTFPDGREKMFNESVRLFTPGELREALATCSVNVQMEFGGYNGEALNADATRVILIGRRD